MANARYNDSSMRNLNMTKANSIKKLSQQALLIVLDGFGLSDKTENNAIKLGHTPHWDEIKNSYPFVPIEASGEAVGLPKGIAGNSEVGHMNLGAGRPVRQDIVRINESIEKKDLGELPEFKKLIDETKKGSGRLHLMGLLSDGGVHSHIDHLLAIYELLKKEEGIQVFFHAFLDGRDTAPKCAEKYLQIILNEKNITLSSMQGRFFGMDRDRRWDRVKKGLQAIIGQGTSTHLSPIEYLNEQYNKNITDEFIEPIFFNNKDTLKSDDSLFFINFRPDRAREITLAFNDPEFKEFSVPIRPSNYLCMTPYVEDELSLPILFDKEPLANGLSEHIAKLNCKQFKIAETEKYAHVTYFFNGGRKQPFSGEEQVLISSPKDVTTYDEKPEMSAFEVKDKLLEALDNQSYSFYLVNFANPDMVGHTGNLEAATQAITEIDKCLGELKEKCAKNNIPMIITADHGNSDQMTYEDGTPHTSHTRNLVPFVIFHPSLKDANIKKNQPTDKYFALKDVAPTILYLLDLKENKTFTGQTIFL